MTLAPYAEHRGVEVAPIGLTNMLNAGGAVLSFQLADERQRLLRGGSSLASRSGSSEDGAGSNGSAPARGVVAQLVRIPFLLETTSWMLPSVLKMLELFFPLAKLL